MSDSRRLLSHYVDKVLDEREQQRLRARLEAEPDFARRAGAYTEDDVLVRDALQSLHLTRGLVERVTIALPAGRPEPYVSRITPLMALLLFLAAALFTMAMVMFQGAAKLPALLGGGSFASLLAHVVSVLVGFVLMVWSGRELVRAELPAVSALFEWVRQPLTRYAAHSLAIGLFCAGLFALLQPKLGWNSIDFHFPIGSTHIALLLLSLPLVMAFIVEAGGQSDNANANEADELPGAAAYLARVSLGRSAGLLMLVPVSALHYLVIAG